MLIEQYRRRGRKVVYKIIDIVVVTILILALTLDISNIAPQSNLKICLISYATIYFVLFLSYFILCKWYDLLPIKKIPIAFLLLVMILFILTVVPMWMGNDQAENLIRGNGVEEQFQQKDNNIGMSNKTLMLITQDGDYNYLIEKNDFKEELKIYVLDRSETKMLIITRHSGGSLFDSILAYAKRWI